MNFDQGWCPRGLCLHDPRNVFPVWVQQNMGASSWQYKKSFIPNLGQKLPILLVFRSNCLFGLAYLTRNLRLFVSGMVENHNLIFASTFLTGPFSFSTTCIRYGGEPQSIIWLLQFGTSQPILKSDLFLVIYECHKLVSKNPEWLATRNSCSVRCAFLLSSAHIETLLLKANLNK